MNMSPLAFADSLRIGTIDYVSPDEIRVLLDIEAPEGVALNTGSPRPFPRINGYVLIPSDDGYLVSQVEWITIERSQYPKRKGIQDVGLVDLPFPLRKMSLNPLGTLTYGEKSATGDDTYRFRRGVDAFPSVGDSVVLPTQNQLRAIVESGEHRHVKIGTSPLAGNAEVKIDPDRLFGRHLAVLGNTGSGKSCSVAGLVRWSLEAAAKECGEGKQPNARFIILDPNGEYTRAFKDDGNARIFAVEPGNNAEQLQVPLWFWNSAEWCAFTQASEKAQRPALVQALRTVRDGQADAAVSPSHEMRRFIRTLVSVIQIERNAGRPWASFPHPKNFFEKIVKWRDGLSGDASFSAEETSALSNLRNKIEAFQAARRGQYPTYDFTRTEVGEFLELAKVAHSAFGGSESDMIPLNADIPRQFGGSQLLRSIEANAEMMNISEYVETMLMRIRTMLADSRMQTITGNAEGVTLDGWLEGHIGNNGAANGTVTIIDLSLVPAEVVQIITSVIARMVFEALQRYRRLHPQHKPLPTVMVMEEAHTFIKRYNGDSESQDAAAICCQVFEKIAREGRKFGLGLVLSSQRPSELSPTVLSQCNTFLLHRISNDRDQELVHKLVPDNLRGLLRDLPSLPSQNAILLGWASELPVLVRMNHLPKEQQPQSDDPDFWNVWTHAAKRTADWKAIADDWQQLDTADPTEVQEESRSEEI
jgi:hypothetical protein